MTSTLNTLSTKNGLTANHHRYNLQFRKKQKAYAKKT